MTKAHTLRLVLRLFGSSSLLALVFVAAPYDWMNQIHQTLGMGVLSDQPVVGYLARTTSAFYALLGGLFWVLSFDLKQNRAVLAYLGPAIVLLGLILLCVDWAEGLPLLWKLWEGPLVMTLGSFIWWASKGLSDR